MVTDAYEPILLSLDNVRNTDELTSAHNFPHECGRERENQRRKRLR
jgi:hypothetical protein